MDEPQGPITEIEDLPNEALFEILKRIEEGSLYNAENVCPLWQQLIDRWLGRTIEISSGKVSYPRNPEFQGKGLELISDMGVRKLHIKHNNGDSLEKHPPVPIPTLKFPHLLQTLGIESRIHPDIFRNLTGGSFNLSRFIITLPTLKNLPSQHLEQLNFPRLRDLEVQLETSLTRRPRRRRPSALSKDAAKAHASLPNLRTLLKENHFRQLKTLDLLLPVEPSKELETAKILIPFILRHRTLKELRLMIFYPLLQCKAMNGNPSNADLNEIIAGIRAHEGFPELTVFKVAIFGQGNHRQSDVWTELVKHFSSLEKIDLSVGPVSYELLKGICLQNGTTMKDLVISNIEHGSCLDLSITSTMTSLEHLMLSSRSKISGASFLPPSLKHIDLTGIMSNRDMEHVLLNIPNISEVELVILNGEQEREDFRLETFQKFAQARKVKQLRVMWMAEPTPEEFPMEGISNGDPENPEMLVCDRTNLEHICWMLNEDGYYQSIDR